MSSRSSSEIYKTMRRLKHLTGRTGLEYREPSELPWIEQLSPLPKLLLDTTVYIDQLQGKLPKAVELSLRVASIWHSTVTECELSALAGLLDPAHPDTARAIDQVLASIEQRPEHRIVNPDREVWREAGAVAGLLARLQQYGQAERRRALNDTLIYLSAAKAGLAVLTRNLKDYDLLSQVAPHGNVAFYRRC